MDLFLNSLELSVPGLTTQAEHRRFETTRDFSDWMVYEWKGRTEVIGDWTLTKRTDGSYEFRYPLRKVDSFADESDTSNVIMRVTVKFPKAVDFANTMYTSGNVATWDVTKADILRGAELRALTVPD